MNTLWLRIKQWFRLALVIIKSRRSKKSPLSDGLKYRNLKKRLDPNQWRMLAVMQKNPVKPVRPLVIRYRKIGAK